MAKKFAGKPNVATIDTKVWDSLRKAIPEFGDAEVVAGVLEERYGSERVEDSDITMAQLARVHEFGIPGKIPERSFMRSTADKPDVQRAVATIVASKIAGAIPKTGAARVKLLESILSKVGQTMVDAIKETIRAGIEPELAASTIAQRRREGVVGNTPLLAHRHLINAISWIVRPR